jgi:hypothetical protein
MPTQDEAKQPGMPTQVEALIEIARGLSYIGDQLARLNDWLPESPYEFINAMRTDHPLQAETLDGIAGGLSEIAQALAALDLSGT